MQNQPPSPSTGPAGNGVTFRTYVITVVPVAVAWCLFWWLVAPSERYWHYYREGGPIDLLSSVFLGAAAFFAWVAWIHARGQKIRGFWLVVALGLTYFMFDERVRLHELAHNEWLWDAYGSAPFGLRNWNDLIVIGYGIAGLVCLLFWCGPVFREGRTRNLLMCGFAFFVLHTVVDSVFDPDGGTMFTTKQIVEEGLKVLAGAFLMLATLSGALRAIQTGDPRSATPPLPGPGHTIIFFLVLAGISFGLLGGTDVWQDLLEDGYWGSGHSWLVGVLLWVGTIIVWVAWRERSLKKTPGGGWWPAFAGLAFVLSLGAMGRATRATFYHRLTADTWFNNARFELEYLHDPLKATTLLLILFVPALAWYAREALDHRRDVTRWFVAAAVLFLGSLVANLLFGRLGNDLLAPILRIFGGACYVLGAMALLCGNRATRDAIDASHLSE